MAQSKVICGLPHTNRPFFVQVLGPPSTAMEFATSQDILDEAEHTSLPVEQLLASDTFQDTLNKAQRTPLPAEQNVDELLASAISQDTLYRVKYAPLPTEQGESLPRLLPPFLSAGSLSPQDSYVQTTPNESALIVTDKESQPENFVTPPSSPSPKPKRRAVLLPLIVSTVLVVLAIAIVVPVYFVVIKPKNNRTSQPSKPPQPTSSSSSSPKSPNSAGAIWGGDGSTVKASNGSTFTYHNKLGGICGPWFPSHSYLAF
jgi:hypothetical protein